MFLGNSRGYIEEKYIEKEYAEKELSTKQKILINNQMERSLCRIVINDTVYNIYGSGFFCYFPFPYNYKCMITNNHILNEKYLMPGKEIQIKINGDKISKAIKIMKNRKTYTNYKFDITIIEILPYDNIDEESFMKIDNNIFTESFNYEYKNKDIYLIYYPNKVNKAIYSLGKIQNISVDNEYKIEHICSTEYGSSGCPILLLNNYRVIGVHGGASEKYNYNLGTLLKGPIKDFINKYSNYSSVIKSGKNLKEQISKNNYSVVEVNYECRFENPYAYKIYKTTKKLKNSGFLCKILIKKKIIPILITGFSCLLKDIISLNICLDKKEYTINIHNPDYSRIKLEEYFGLSIIEIKPEDNLDISTFGVISDKIYFFNQDSNLLNRRIYIIHFLPQKDISVISYGNIKKREDEYIYYDCKTDVRSLGAPIYDLETNTILGVHMGFHKDYYEKFGYKMGKLLPHILENLYNHIKSYG